MCVLKASKVESAPNPGLSPCVHHGKANALVNPSPNRFYFAALNSLREWCYASPGCQTTLDTILTAHPYATLRDSAFASVKTAPEST